MRNKDIVRIVSENEKRLKELELFEHQNKHFNGDGYSWGKGKEEEFESMKKEYEQWLNATVLDTSFEVHEGTHRESYDINRPSHLR